jgi:hypothetical protein
MAEGSVPMTPPVQVLMKPLVRGLMVTLTQAPILMERVDIGRLQR